MAFYGTIDEAEAAGFRPCKRCQPDGQTLAETTAEKVAAACRIIETADTPPSLKELARQGAMSPFHFHRLFKKITGLTPKEYFAGHRAGQLRKLLPRRDTVTRALYDAGFNSNSRFYATSSKMLGMKPKQFRKYGEGENIRFATGRCSLGFILVAATEKGVCTISLGDDLDSLVSELRTNFRKANLERGDQKFGKLIQSVVEFVESPKIGINLPLDIRGTAFQQRVWKALREVRIGSTTSYSELAVRLGMPNSVRAVAGACAANNIALAIPCHRVIRTSGELSGYRWGVKRKQTLLQREKAARR